MRSFREPHLIGADPLAIERHFQAMTGVIHPFRPNYAFISGIDIALWDVAGKILDLPIYKLMGGPSAGRRADVFARRYPKGHDQLGSMP